MRANNERRVLFHVEQIAGASTHIVREVDIQAADNIPREVTNLNLATHGPDDGGLCAAELVGANDPDFGESRAEFAPPEQLAATRL
jgi:hypothetical protein